MNQQSDIEKEYEGLHEDYLKQQQIEIAVQALHVIAVMQEGDPSFLSSVAIDALKEMETSGYYYDSFITDYL
tara:strand:- start:3561 stop:3776 length:216 start_codon:yes stop_codon:yes gene_type:complete